MPNWAYGIVEVNGTKNHVMAFSRHFPCEESILTCHLYQNERPFYRSIVAEKREEFEADLLSKFEEVPQDEEATVVFQVEFAWSAFDCIIRMGFFDDCISLREACSTDHVDAKIWTKEMERSFGELISCTRDGELTHECQRLKYCRCQHCGDVVEIAFYEDPATYHCYECGGDGFTIIEEDEINGAEPKL